MTRKQSSDADKAAEDAVVAKVRGGVAQTDLTADELAAFARATAPVTDDELAGQAEPQQDSSSSKGQ